MKGSDRCRVVRRRSRWQACVAVVLLGSSVIAQPPGARLAAANDAVTWTVDHAAKKISVTANLAVFLVPPPDSDFGRRVFIDALARMKASIESRWNGHHFKCYAVEVKVNVRAAADPRDIQPNEAAIQLDPAIYPVGETVKLREGRSITRLLAPEGETYLSDDPQLDLIVGVTVHPSRWALVATAGTFAHEFGHVLGLDDNYVEGEGTLRDGATGDMMFHQNLLLSDETIVKVVRRSGEVAEADIKCPLKLDLAKASAGLPGFASVDVEVHGCAPDYTPASTDTGRPAGAHFQGTVTGGGELPFLGGGSGTVGFDTLWDPRKPEIEIQLNGGAVAQAVAVTGSGPISVSSAVIRTSGGTLGLSGSFVITPFDGPCP